MRILLAEDDSRIGTLVKRLLENEKIEVDWVQNGHDVYTYAECSMYDILLLDWVMPDVSGIDVCSELRKKGYRGGIILLTGKDTIADRVKGLDAGADDYILKPFEFEELLARIRAVARRSEHPIKEDIIRVDDLELDITNRKAKREGREIPLSCKECNLLELFMKNPEKLLTRDKIINRVWGLESEISSNNLDAHVRLLRKKLNQPGEKTLIHNVRGVGYRLYAKIDR